MKLHGRIIRYFVLASELYIISMQQSYCCQLGHQQNCPNLGCSRINEVKVLVLCSRTGKSLLLLYSLDICIHTEHTLLLKYFKLIHAYTLGVSPEKNVYFIESMTSRTREGKKGLCATEFLINIYSYKFS